MEQLEGDWFHTSQKPGVDEKYTCKKLNTDTHSLECISTKKKNDLATLRVSGNSNSVILTIKTLWEIHGTLSVYQNQLRISWRDGSKWTKRNLSPMVVTIYLDKAYNNINTMQQY